MTELAVIYDNELEVAAIVDMDKRTALGPCWVGPTAVGALTAFTETIPYDLGDVPPDVLRGWFEQFVGVTFPPPSETDVPGSDGSVVAPGGEGMADAALAEREAAYAGAEPPPPQPADTDVEANAGEAATVTETEAEPPPAEQQYEGVCFACNGTGSVPTADPAQPVTCNLCKGTGQLPAPE